MFRKYSWFSYVILFSLTLQENMAQDIHFSMFELSPSYLSPAMTGYTNGATHHITTKYRTQWSAVLPDQPYETLLANYNLRLCSSSTKNFFGLGGSIMNDRTGQPTFETTQIQLAVAYHLRLTSGNFISLGLKGGLLRYQIDPNDFDFDNEFDGLFGFNNISGSSGDILTDQVNLWDTGGGVLFYNPSEIWHIGLGFHHITRQSYFNFTQGVENDNNRVNTRWVLHGSSPSIGLGKLQKHLFTFKGMILIQSPHWQAILGSDFRLQIYKNQHYNFLQFMTPGLALRLSNHSVNSFGLDAIVFSMKMDISTNMLIGVSYDISISPLQRELRVGAFELSFVTQFGSSSCISCYTFDKAKKGKKQKPRVF